MASVQLETFWISDANNLSDVLPVEYVTGLAPFFAVPGEFRTSANGRTRLVISAGAVVRRAYDVTIGLAKRSDVQWIEAHIGRVLLIRDPMGRKFYGAYLETKPAERRGENAADISLTFTAVTRSEVV